MQNTQTDATIHVPAYVYQISLISGEYQLHYPEQSGHITSTTHTATNNICLG